MLAARMSLLPRTAMQQALAFFKNGAVRFQRGVGMLCCRPFPVFSQDFAQVASMLIVDYDKVTESL
jgi:hypothetical protein